MSQICSKNGASKRWCRDRGGAAVAVAESVRQKLGREVFIRLKGTEVRTQHLSQSAGTAMFLPLNTYTNLAGALRCCLRRAGVPNLPANRWHALRGGTP